MIPKRRRILRVAAVIMILAPFMTAALYGEDSVGDNVFDLTTLYQRALTYSERIRIGEEQLFIDSLLKEKARSVLIPRLDAFGDHTRYDEKKSYMGSVLQPESSTAYGLSASQSFTLNGKELVAYRIAEDTIRRSRHDLEAVKETYLFEVASAYYDLIRAIKAEKIAAANVDRLQQYRDAVITRLNLEAVPKTDLFRAEAELSNAKAERIAATNRIELARAVLSRVAMIDGEFEIVIPDDDAITIPEVDLSEVKAVAMENRAEIKVLKVTQEIADKQITFTKGEYWPQVTVEGTYRNVEQEPSAPLNDTDSLSVGLTLAYPLFDGGLRRANVSEARAQKRQADLAYADLVKQIRIEVEDAYLSFITLNGVLSSLKDQFEYARENIESVARQYQNGLADSLDVLDANTLLTTSETQLSEAWYQLQLAVLRLDRVKGTFLSGIIETLNDNHLEEVTP